MSLTPYQYGANNPVLMIDVNGDSINVAEKYREQFNKALESIFGDKASNFSYNKSGNLVYNGTKKDFKGKTRKVFKKMSKVIGEETTTNVIYEASTQIVMNDGTTQIIYASQGGGALTVLTSENNVSENTILIDPNAPTSFSVNAVNDAYYKFGVAVPGFTTYSVKVSSSQQNLFWHELGHVIYQGKSQDKVLNFDNMTRSLNISVKMMPTKAPGYDKGASGYKRKIYKNSPFSPRPDDDTHNRLIK